MLMILTVNIMQGAVWHCDCATGLFMWFARTIKIASKNEGVALR